MQIFTGKFSTPGRKEIWNRSNCTPKFSKNFRVNSLRICSIPLAVPLQRKNRKQVTVESLMKNGYDTLRHRKGAPWLQLEPTERHRQWQNEEDRIYHIDNDRQPPSWKQKKAQPRRIRDDDYTKMNRGIYLMSIPIEHRDGQR